MADTIATPDGAGAYATAQDILSRWIASTLPPDETVISSYLADASVLMDAEFPDLAQRVKSDPATRARAAVVARRMVMRVLTNPDQIRQVNETSGPFSGGVTYAAETLNGLYLSDEDRALLSASPARTQQAWAIDPTPAPTTTPDEPVLYGTQVVTLPEVD
ncbi:hypothetical protein [Actinomyces urogenitalis]|jgi:hypothetical protein|uniref:hypothetical protein n=1 Tax=Actinomyces urogenitalis TaxID=103621 RepID=UPI0018971406|nr:hypothetical protein [Actinomyces urogenitalis]MDK8236792.1 hypothetical protein [Actinomyces urogenitalis]MDU6151211.1 hypothetical protein [Actinomyces urogenitalis]WOO94856.1 hypothetical protein R3I39_09250 [Actinomyces urogenitalis]